MRNCGGGLKTLFDGFNGSITDPVQVMLQIAHTCVGIVDQPTIDLFRATIQINPSGEAWCADFMQSLIAYAELRFQMQSPVFATESTHFLWENSQCRVIGEPRPGDIIVWAMGDTGLGHCGMLVSSDSIVWNTIEGNTTPYGQAGEIQRQGNGVWAKKRAKGGTQTFKELGFLRVFP